jgi:hypothetical protein
MSFSFGLQSSALVTMRTLPLVCATHAMTSSLDCAMATPPTTAAVKPAPAIAAMGGDVNRPTLKLLSFGIEELSADRYCNPSATFTATHGRRCP